MRRLNSRYTETKQVSSYQHQKPVKVATIIRTLLIHDHDPRPHAGVGDQAGTSHQHTVAQRWVKS